RTAAAAETTTRRGGRLRQRGGETGRHLLLRQRACLGGIPLGEPALEGGPHLIAGHTTVLVGVERGEEPRRSGATTTTSSAARSGRRARRRLLRDGHSAAIRRGHHRGGKRRLCKSRNHESSLIPASATDYVQGAKRATESPLGVGSWQLGFGASPTHPYFTGTRRATDPMVDA